MAAESNWSPGYTARISHNATEAHDITLELAETIGEFEATGGPSAGDEEFGVDVKSRRFRFDTPLDADAPVTFPLGTLADIIYTDGITYRSGKGRILSKTERGGGKGGLTYQYEGKFTGPVNEVSP